MPFGEIFTVVGMMSGTSLDGLDLVLCRFEKVATRWNFTVLKSESTAYPETLKKQLVAASSMDGLQLISLHNQYGVFVGEKINHFLESTGIRPDLVASHGHTVFHQPQRNLTFQIGSGAYTAATCGLTTVSDFRTLDVALGGQGAPLVPLGDRLLFSNYEFCLNLGGFANISNEDNGRRIACDICPVNIVANKLAQRVGFEYDAEGKIGESGTISQDLVNDLNLLPFYAQRSPKSLGREWVESEFMPLLARYALPLEDLLKSFYEHAAIQISNYINSFDKGTVLVTGGGALNTELVKLIMLKTKSRIIIPEEGIVNFKEAIIFALMGLLRYRNEINCLSTVTGASADSSSGIVYLVS